MHLQAGTRTGRVVGKLVGANLAHYTAELGGKARATLLSMVYGLTEHL